MEFVGILELQLSQRYQTVPITLIQRFIVLCFLIVAFVTSSWYCIFEAESFHDLMIEALYPALGYAIALVMYCISLWKRNEILNLFHIVDTIIQNRM